MLQYAWVRPLRYLQMLFESLLQVDLGFLFPISQPHPLSVLTTFGVTAAVNGTRMKMKDL